jgi:hypothetical protein
MYSKSKRIATPILLLGMLPVLAACAGLMPWRNEPIGDEVNLVFDLQNNLLFLPGAIVSGHTGRFFFASALPKSVVDSRWARSHGSPRRYTLQLSEKESLRFSPALLDLGGAGDVMIGADVWGSRAVTLDYQKGLLTFQKEGIHPELMTLFHYDREPAVTATVDGLNIAAVVDTSSPDTMVLPSHASGRATGRGSAKIAIAGADFGAVDVRYAKVDRPRIGNRLLSKFLVTIDYGRQQVGLWRDPRIR